MKKVSFSIMAVLLIALMAFNVCAATNAFEKITVSPDYPKVIDNTEGREAGFVENFGIGNTDPGDVAEFTDLDFGKNGAKSATIGFAFGNEGSSSLIEMYVDSLDSKPAATFDCGYTGGWDTASIQDFTADVSIPAGVHTIYFKWTNATGSLHNVVFTQADAAVTTPTAPQAADMGLTVSLVGIALAGTAVYCLKKRH